MWIKADDCLKNVRQYNVLWNRPGKGASEMGRDCLICFHHENLNLPAYDDQQSMNIKQVDYILPVIL